MYQPFPLDWEIFKVKDFLLLFLHAQCLINNMALRIFIKLNQTECVLLFFQNVKCSK